MKEGLKGLLIGVLFVLGGLGLGTDLLAQAAPAAASKGPMLGILSLGALVVAVVISCFSERNVGIMCIAFGFIIAMLPGSDMKVAMLAKVFPLRLFMILVGATLLFSMATNNGTIEKLAKWSVKGSRGVVGLLPIIFFFLGFLLSSIGPGNIACTVVLAPVAMALCGATRISPFLMTLMLVNGANAGALSPLAPTGIIANGLVEKIHLEYIGNQIYFNSLLGNGAAAMFGFVAFGGFKLFGGKVDEDVKQRVRDIVDAPIEPWSSKQYITLACIASWIVLVLFFKWDVGYTALMFAVPHVLLQLCR